MSGPPVRATRWSRRAVLVLAAGLAGTLAGRSAAIAGEVSVDGLSFAVPDGVTPGVDAGVGGRGWQWTGGRPGAVPDRPSVVVLARADIASSVPEEVLGLVLATSASGGLPGLRIGRSRTRAMPGGGEQHRVEVTYDAARDLAYHGTILVATRARGRAGLLAVLGDDALTAGTIDGVLDSARWVD